VKPETAERFDETKNKNQIFPRRSRFDYRTGFGAGS
jgi:hypothetical protein